MIWTKTSTTICPDCKQAPRYNTKENAYRCACEKKRWKLKKPMYGSVEVQALFKRKCFEQLKDASGDLYYIGPENQLIHLYDDGTWEGAIVQEGTPIEDYLNSLTPEIPNYRRGADWMTYGIHPEHSELYEGSDDKQLALTFDDGPNDRDTEALLDVLAEFNVPATFFMVGKYVKQRKAIARKVAEAGHQIGNHTFDHLPIALIAESPEGLLWQDIPADDVLQRITKCQHEIEDATQTSPTFFRPPLGWNSNAAEALVRQCGLKTVIWSVIPRDWEPDATVERIFSRVREAIDSRKQGEIVLLHDGDGNKDLGADRSNTVKATRKLLEHYSIVGKQFVSLNDFKN